MWIYEKRNEIKWTDFSSEKRRYSIGHVTFRVPKRLKHSGNRGEDANQQQFLVRATFFSFSRTSHLEIHVLPILFLFKCLMIIQDKKIRSSKNKILNFLIWKKKIFQLKFSSLMSLKMFTFFRAFLDSPGVKCHK